MNTPSVYDHAIVIGGSIAGMSAARMLADHFAQVTVVERDGPPDPVAFRKGAPQTRHPHALLAEGQRILENIFPGIVQELHANGALAANFGNQLGFYINGSWCQPYESPIVTTMCSRPLLDNAIYRRLSALPNVTILHNQEMLGLCLDNEKKRVAGVRLRERGETGSESRVLNGALVVDASGRDSRAPQWLEEWGYTPPAETSVNAFIGYTTRIYRTPPHYTNQWKALYIMAMAPHTPRGAVILPMEGDRWHVCLVGVGGDYPPTDEAGWDAFIDSLPSPEIAEALKDAEPLTAPYGYRRAENRMRYYEKLPRYVEGLVMTGDAVYAFNPIYGQGMSTAAIASQMLDACVKEQRRRHGEQTLDGLARRFQKELASVTAGPWAMATGQDIRWPTTVGGAKPDPVTKLVQGYLDRVLAVAPHNPAVAEAFFQVQNMLKGPESLFHPKILWQVLKPQPSKRAAQPAPVGGMGEAVTA